MGARWYRWVLVGVAAVMLALLAVPLVSTLHPGYYRRFPALGPRMSRWETSTHSRISCAECHIDPGVRGFVSFAARAVPAFYSQLVEGPRDTNLLRPPSASACRQCHTSYRKVSPAGDLLIPHRAHVEVLKMACVDCHKDLVHSLNERGFNRPTMKGCLTCHDGSTASSACTDCHTRKQVPATHLKADWLSIHGSVAESELCGSCHAWTPDYCSECHEKRPASHVGNWKKAHGPHAKKRGAGCLVCHGGQKFCDRCH